MIDTPKGLVSPTTATERVAASMAKRKKSERNFQLLGRSAIAVALAFLVVLFFSIFSKGLPGFFQYYVEIEVEIDREKLDPTGDLSLQSLYDGDARGVIRSALYAAVDAEGRKNKRAAGKLISAGAEQRLRELVYDDPSLMDTTQTLRFALDDDVDSFLRGFIKRETPEKDRRISDKMVEYIDRLQSDGKIVYAFSDYLIFGSASRNPEMAGIYGAFIGSILTLSVCLVLAFPIGVATAIYLEEIAPKNRITEIIEININNLAAVPSVVISSRAAIRAVPPSVREAALGVGASQVQTIFHHVIPLAMPGMLTGTIIGMAQALGETAPLLMIGMVAFIVDVPGGVTDPGTVLPVQIFMWADFAERMFVQKTSAAIIVLLAFLITMNAAAIIVRKKLERRW